MDVRERERNQLSIVAPGERERERERERECVYVCSKVAEQHANLLGDPSLLVRHDKLLHGHVFALPSGLADVAEAASLHLRPLAPRELLRSDARYVFQQHRLSFLCSPSPSSSRCGSTCHNCRGRRSNIESYVTITSL